MNAALKSSATIDQRRTLEIAAVAEPQPAAMLSEEAMGFPPREEVIEAYISSPNPVHLYKPQKRTLPIRSITAARHSSYSAMSGNWASSRLTVHLVREGKASFR